MKRRRNSNFQDISLLFLFILSGFLAYWFGRSAMWFICGLMIARGTVIERVEKNDSLAECLGSLLIALTLVVTGVAHIASNMTVQALFLSVRPYTTYHALIHISWIILWLVFTLLNVISSGGRWTFTKFLKSLLKSAFLLFSIANLTLLVQLQHSGQPLK